MSKSNFGYPFKREDPGRPRPSCCQYRPQPRTEGLYHLAGIIALLSRAIALLPPSPVLSMCPVVEIPDDDDDDDPFYDDDDDHSVDLRSSRICTTSSSSSVSKATKYFVVVKSSAHSTHDPTTSMLDPNGGLEDSEDHQNGSRNAALSEDDNRIMQLLARLLDWNISEGRFAKCFCPQCSRTSPWGCLLAKLRPKLRDNVSGITPEGDRWDSLLQAMPWSVVSQTSCLLYLWLADALSHPLVDQHCVAGIEHLWPLKATRLPADIAKFLYGSGLPALEPASYDPIREGAENALKNPFLEEYAGLCLGLCSQVLGQLSVCECPDLDVLNRYTKTSTELRRRYGWSVPNEASLSAIAKHSPLVEIGGGRGYWASLLAAKGADVACYSSMVWRSKFNSAWGEHSQGYTDELNDAGDDFFDVKDGGPEALDDHPDRTLVLMWPDYQGSGTFGVECLQRYAGDYLILVGEWVGRTFGAYREGLPNHGQSFSCDFQAAVKESFNEVEVIRVPNWPLFLDVVSIHKRKSLAELMSQTEGETGGDGFLSAFFMGAFDPTGGTEGDVDEDEEDAALVKELTAAAAVADTKKKAADLVIRG